MFTIITRKRLRQLEARIEAVTVEAQAAVVSAEFAKTQSSRAVTFAKAANTKADTTALAAERAIATALGAIDLVMPTPPHLKKEKPTDG